MRLSAGLLVCGALLLASPARAQQDQKLSGAFRFAQAMVGNTDTLASIETAAAENVVPPLRQQVLNSPNVVALDEAGRARVAAYVDTFPQLFTRLFALALPALEQDIAAQLEAQFTQDELADIAAYAESPGGGSFLRRAMSAGIRGGGARTDKAQTSADLMRSLTPEESSALVAFVSTPGGKAFTKKGNQIGSITKAAMGRQMPGLLEGARKDVCEKLGPSLCPPA